MANRASILRRTTVCAFASLVILVLASPAVVRAQVASISAWEVADFRSWSFIPNWTTQSQIDSFRADRVYEHVSDVLYSFGVQPRADGSLFFTSASTGHLARLKSDQAMFGFRYHMCMFTVNGGSTDSVWETITANRNIRATFINNVKSLLAANNMTGMNLDWERPNSASEWGNYTQLAKEMQAAFPAEWEVSVDDYGSADSRWNDSPLFDPDAFDQVGLMAYHYPSSSQATWANTHTALGFSDSQLILGMGTWGVPPDDESLMTLKEIVVIDPNLPANASSFSRTINGTTKSWDIVSRYEVRDNVQLAINRGMAGIMWWTLSYDATNKMSLARVAQHYAMFKKNVPDLNLDGKVNAADATTLADNMGTVPGWTGTNTAARFETFYMNGNWEKGDRDGNGFVNQADADWLAGRYATLGVALPDRLAYTGTFEMFNNSVGDSGRWAAVRGPANQLPETGNYTQHNPGFLTFTGTGPGAGKHSNSAVTIRNQNAAEAFDSLNMAPRMMSVDLATPIDLGDAKETYVTFLVRQNTSPLLPTQVGSVNRTLALELLDAGGVNQFDFAFLGQQAEFRIRSQADAAGDDSSSNGFAADATFLFVAKIAGNGAAANTLQASLFAPGATVGNFTDPIFPWMLTAHGGDGFNPTITQLQFTSLFEANSTLSNVWVGPESSFFASPTPGDFNADGTVDAADLALWHAGFGSGGTATHWQGDSDGDADVDGADFLVWQQNLGVTTAAPGSSAVPEPTTAAISLAILCAASARLRRNLAAR